MTRIRDVEHLRRLIPVPPTLGGASKKGADAKILDHLDEQSLQFITDAPFLIVASIGPDGIELSPKGDDGGFVVVEDSRTILIPERSGNGLALGLQNMIADDRVGVTFLRPNAEELLRITGRVELIDDAEICRRMEYRGKPAILVMRVRVERAFFHCARSLRRAGLWKPETWPDPLRISFGKILAAALQQKELEAQLDGMVEEYNNNL